MEGDEQFALDIVTAYRGFLGGMGVALTSSALRNYNKNNKNLFTFKSFAKSMPLLITVPIFMVAIRRASVMFNGEKNEDGE